MGELRLGSVPAMRRKLGTLLRATSSGPRPKQTTTTPLQRASSLCHCTFLARAFAYLGILRHYTRACRAIFSSDTVCRQCPSTNLQGQAEETKGNKTWPSAEIDSPGKCHAPLCKATLTNHRGPIHDSASCSSQFEEAPISDRTTPSALSVRMNAVNSNCTSPSLTSTAVPQAQVPRFRLPHLTYLSAFHTPRFILRDL